MTAGLLIAAPRSGSGKTTVTLGLLAALRRRGIRVRAAKSGPDYIDPAFHAAATGKPSFNLDSWAMPPALLDGLVAQAAEDAEILVIEASMGLFDGVPAPPGGSGAGADLAARFHLPVVLVMDVSGQSQSAAATVRGFATHRDGVRLAGVVLNQVASPRHRQSILPSIEALGLPVFGVLARDPSLTLPERHLGLVQAGELADLEAQLHRLADCVEAGIDLDAVIAAAAPVQATLQPFPALPPPGQRIALASDAAFTFLYSHFTQSWRQAGAEILPFSPLADEPPPAGCDVCWLPGGYPELHAGTLAGASRFLAGLREFSTTRPVHGECGGYMVLGQVLEDAQGVMHPMAGLLGHGTSFARRRLHLGYRTAELLAGSPIGPAGAFLRGHEFHYASLIDDGGIGAAADEPLARLRDGYDQELGLGGSRKGRVSGTFFHAIASYPFQR